jgi:hypothetical protein
MNLARFSTARLWKCHVGGVWETHLPAEGCVVHAASAVGSTAETTSNQYLAVLSAAASKPLYSFPIQCSH